MVEYLAHKNDSTGPVLLHRTPAHPKAASHVHSTTLEDP
jgi:hypothetical protein